MYITNKSKCVRPRQRKHSTVLWQSVNSSSYHGGPMGPKKYLAPEWKIPSGQRQTTKSKDTEGIM